MSDSSLSRTLSRTLYHRHVVVRAATLAALGILLHLLAWGVGFHLLAPEALRGVFLSSRIPVVGGSQADTLLRIVVVNLVLGVGLVAAANTFRVGRFPLGYLPALFHWTGYGLFNGTGSFSAGTTPPLPPSLSGLLTNRGSWEILAYTIVAAATVNLFLFRQRSWLDWSTRKERPMGDISVSRWEWAAVVLALLMLVAANWTEARSLMAGVPAHGPGATAAFLLLYARSHQSGGISRGG